MRFTVSLACALLPACAGPATPDSAPPEAEAPFEAPSFSLDPEAVDFGVVDAPAQREEVLMLLNEGPGPLTLFALAVDAPALQAEVAEGLPLEIPARQTAGVVLRCVASTSATAVADLALTLGWVDPERGEQRLVHPVPLRCRTRGPELRVAQAALDLGRVPLPCSARASWTLINQGELAMGLTQTGLEADPGLGVDPQGGPTWQLDPGELLALEVTFTPVDEGPAALRLTLEPSVGEALTLEATGQGLLDEAVTDRFTGDGQRRTFGLSASPLPQTLRLSLDGADGGGWSLDAARQELTLPAAPADGVAVEVAYHPEAPCGE